MLETGLKYTAETVVSDSNTATSYGSGGVDVFATPAMVALMENAARHAVATELPEGSTTVGVAISVVHNHPTPIGETVRATAVLVRIEGRTLVFDVVANDNQNVIGQGTHTRVIVDTKKFMAKARK